MGRPTRSISEMMRRGSFVTWFTFLVGVPLGIGVLFFILETPFVDETLKRYVQHEAEQAVVILFFCCLCALAAKLMTSLNERYVQSLKLLPAWDGKPIPVSEVKQLQHALNLVWKRVQSTYLGRRVANILNFVESRGSANELDDQMRCLSDNDIMGLDSSYSLMRFIIWAMPILGFLGTVLGITQAISGISPEQLEKGADVVANGLTKAFDATALALSLTLVAMFINSMVERLEQGLLERVDLYIEDELAHRFIRTQPGSASAPVIGAEMYQFLDKQANLWANSMQLFEEQWTHKGTKQQETLAAALQQSMEAAVTRYTQRMAELEKKLIERHQAMLEGLNKSAVGMKESGREHQLSLARLTDAIGLSVEMITKVQSNESQLLRLQETLNQNLTLLANSATFEQAVESLTAAIHLLTTRVNPAQQTQAPRVLPLPNNHAA